MTTETIPQLCENDCGNEAETTCPSCQRVYCNKCFDDDPFTCEFCDKIVCSDCPVNISITFIGEVKVCERCCENHMPVIGQVIETELMEAKK